MLHRVIRGASTTALAGAILLQMTTASVAATAGATCAHVGATARQGNAELRCTKSAGRVIWRIVVAKPLPDPQAEPDHLLGTACDDPGHELFNAAGPIRCTRGSWQSIREDKDSVASRAYRSLMAQYWAHPASQVRLRPVTDTATASLVEVLERGIRAADRLWSVKLPQQPVPVVVAQNSHSLNVQATALGLKVDEATRADLEAQEATAGGCGQGTYMEFAGQPWMFFCIGVLPRPDTLHHRAFASLSAHEFTHMALDRLMRDRRGRVTCLRTAPWFDEGLASYTMAALGDVAGAGGDLRSAWADGLGSARATLADFNYADPRGSREHYALGMFAAEALYALEGASITERLLTACSTGLTFSASFKSVTGHSLESWTPVLSKYVESVKVGRALSLANLQTIRRTKLPDVR